MTDPAPTAEEIAELRRSKAKQAQYTYIKHVMQCCFLVFVPVAIIAYYVSYRSGLTALIAGGSAAGSVFLFFRTLGELIESKLKLK